MRNLLWFVMHEMLQITGFQIDRDQMHMDMYMCGQHVLRQW